MIKEKILSWAICIGWSGLIIIALVFYYIFLTAFFGGTNQVMVNINKFNEAKFEFVLLMILFPAMVYTFIYEMKNMKTPYYKKINNLTDRK